MRQMPPEGSTLPPPDSGEPSPPAPLPRTGSGEAEGHPGADPHTEAAPGVESSSPAQRERVWGEGRRRFLLTLLTLQVILILVGLVYWYRTPTSPALPPVPDRPAPRINGGATYESGLPIAQAQADAWLPGARLLNAAMQVDWDWTVPYTPVTILPPTGWLTYTFIAPWQPWGKPPGAASLDVIFDRLSGEVVRQDTLGWATAPEWREPPPPSAINSTQATLRAEAAGGTAFRRGCPDLRHLSRTFPVAAGRTEWPQHWVIIYEDTRVREQQGLLVRVDAETGEVLETRQDAPACPETP